MQTGFTRTVITGDDKGRYRATALLLGSDQVEASVVGFQTAVRTGMTLTVGREAQQVEDLALNGWSYTQLALLQPGVVTVGGTSFGSVSGGGELSVAGTRSTTNLGTLDQLDNSPAFRRVHTLWTFKSNAAHFSMRHAIDCLQPRSRHFLW